MWTALCLARHGLSFALGLARRVVSREARALVSEICCLGVRSFPLFCQRAGHVFAAVGRCDRRQAPRRPARFAAAVVSAGLEAAGGLLVKLAQVIAHSPAVAPRELVLACRSSLARCRAEAASGADVLSLLEAELPGGAATFASVEAEPLARASIAQVHGAVMRDGTRVVIKIIRPGVRERLAADLELLTLLARLGDLLLGAELVSRLVSASLQGAVAELRDAIWLETDLAAERRNLASFQQWLDTSSALGRAGLRGAVLTPTPVPEGCTERVLTMARVEGTMVSCMLGGAGAEGGGDGRGGRARGDGAVDLTLPEANEALDALGRALAVAALSIVEGGLFHADLHAGNMLLCDGGRRVAFIDFGVCGTLPRHLRGALLLQALSLSTGDTLAFAESFAFAMRERPSEGHGGAGGAHLASRGRPSPSSFDPTALDAALRPLWAEFELLNPFGAGDGRGRVDPAFYALVGRGQALLAAHGVQLPHEFGLLVKTLVFGAQYVGIFAAGGRLGAVSKQLGAAATAYALSCPAELASMLTGRAAQQLARVAAGHAASLARRRLRQAGLATVAGLAQAGKLSGQANGGTPRPAQRRAVARVRTVAAAAAAAVAVAVATLSVPSCRWAASPLGAAAVGGLAGQGATHGRMAGETPDGPSVSGNTNSSSSSLTTVALLRSGVGVERARVCC